MSEFSIDDLIAKDKDIRNRHESLVDEPSSRFRISRMMSPR